MSYTVLARRYRSQTFDDVVGQEASARTLKNAIATDRVAHAYLFTGTRGVGKTTMARILAKALNCLKYDAPTPTPCCQCDSCLAIHEGEDIDVLEIDGASNTGVEHIRELRQNSIYRPARARFKIYIIDEVHMLSVSAFNALLKTLEEPPEHVKFILATTEPNKVLATIQSRCQRFDFRNIHPKEIAEQLQKILTEEGIQAEEALVRRVARLANGSMRDALSLLDQLLSMAQGELTLELLAELLGTPRSERIVALADAICGGDIAAVLTQADVALGEGLALEPLAQALQEHFRDLLVLRHCPMDTDLVDVDEASVRQTLLDQSKRFDEAALVYNITVMEELRRSLKASDTGRPLFEAALVRLAANDRFSDTKALLEQLHGLQGMQDTIAPAGRTPPSPASPSRQPQAPAREVSAANHASPTSRTTDKPPSMNTGDLELPDTITGDYLRDHWNIIKAEIINRGQKHLAAYLQPARPLDVQDGQITLGFGIDDGMGRLLASQPAIIQEIEEALAGILARPIKVRITQLAQDTEPSAAKKAKRSPGAKLSQQEINSAMSDPQVQKVQQTLGGRVRKIDRVDE
jgi:DNA polymerase-3 subunit gamma/tau